MRGPTTAAAGLLAVLLVTGCNTVVTGRGAQSGVPAGGPSPATATATVTSTATTTSSVPSGDPGAEPAVFELGDTGTVSDSTGAPLADVTVSAATLSMTPPDEFSDPPDNGAFLAATVTIDNVGDSTFPVAPLDFEVRYPDGTQIRYGTGSTGVFGFDEPLGALNLAAGDAVTGVVAFDVDPALTGARIAYLDLSGRVLGVWLVP